MEKNKTKVVIVGAGMAGLTAGAYLCKNNYDVLLLDRSNGVGGLVQTFEKNGFFFDTGPRAFVNSGMIKPILRDLDIEFEALDNKISIAIEDQILTVKSIDSLKEYKNMLLNLYPEKANDIEKIMKSVYKLSKYTQTLYAFDNPYFVDYESDIKSLFTELLPWTFKMIFAMKKFDQYSLPMEEHMLKLTDSQPITDILTQIFFRGTPSYFALGYFYVWLDYFYPKGGTGLIPDRLKKKILESGNKIKLNTQIDQLIPSTKKIIDSKGNQYEYDYLIWTADLKHLYQTLDPIGIDEIITEKINRQKELVLKAKPAESNFSLNLAVDRPPAYFEERGGEHAFYTFSKRGLGEIHKDRKEELIENFDKKSKGEVLAWLDDFCKYNTYEVSIPVLRDPTLAPQGRTGIMISCLFDYIIMEKVNKAGWLDEFKERIENNIIEIFAQSFYKDIGQDILFKFSNTPLTIKNALGSSGGSIVGWSFETESPVVNNLKEMPKSVLTPIPDVFQAGQWSYAPAGVPVAMLTGWHASQKIIEKSKEK